MEFMMNWRWLIATVIVFGGIAVVTAYARRRTQRLIAARAGAGGGGTQPPTVNPANPATAVAQTGTQPHVHNPAEPALLSMRIGVLVLTGVLLWIAVYFAMNFVLSKTNIDSFYTVILSCIGWIALAIPAFKLFFRTVGVYQVAHTQDMVTGKLRAYDAGTKLILPWETLTEDKIVDTEAKLITIPETKVTTADGSPMLAFGQIRYRVARHLSHLYIGVKKDDVEKSLLAVAIQLAREETARYADPEAAIKALPDPVGGPVRVFGLISTIEDRFMNGPQTTRIEGDHGVQVEGVPLSIVMAPETEKRFLERLEDFRLAESATALLGVPRGTVVSLKDRLEATRLALLNNPDAKLTHTISEEQETGDRTYKLTIDGTSGESLKDIAATATVVAQAFAAAKQKGGGQKPPKPHNQPQQPQKGNIP